MATIFSVVGPRQLLTWQAKKAAIYAEVSTIGDITGAETFTLEFSSGGPISMNTMNAPYINLAALLSDFDAQIDAAIGSGVAGTVDFNNGHAFCFADGVNSSVTVSNFDSTYYSIITIANITRDTSVVSSTINPQAVLSGAAFPEPYHYPMDGISSLYEIPSGSKKISFWITSEGNETASPDGYATAYSAFILWTNGIDGYVVDGYSDELMTNPYHALDAVNGFINENSAIYLGTPVENYTKIGSVLTVDVPSGITGAYLAIPAYVNPNTLSSAYPPTITVHAIASS